VAASLKQAVTADDRSNGVSNSIDPPGKSNFPDDGATPPAASTTINATLGDYRNIGDLFLSNASWSRILAGGILEKMRWRIPRTHSALPSVD
jgi:hypothetical protein